MAWSKRLLPRAHITHRLSPLRNLRTPPPSARGDSSANCKAPISICRRRRSSIATRSLPHKCALVPSCGGKTSQLIRQFVHDVPRDGMVTKSGSAGR